MMLTLPPPISANRYWRSYVPKGWTRALVVVSPEAKAYKRECAWRMKAAGFRAPVKKHVPLTFSMLIYPKDRRVLDVDNALKVVIDSLKGICFEDDRQIQKIVIERMEPCGEPRAEIEIREYIPTGKALLAEATK